MIIYTDNYLIRNFKAEDAERFYRLAHDADVKKYVPYAYCEDYETAEELMSYYEKGDCKNDFYLGIFRESDLIGSIIANKVNIDTLEICTLVSYHWRNKGVMTEAMNGFIKWLSENTTYQKLKLVVEKTNTASLKQVEKLNAELENKDFFDKVKVYQIFLR